MTDAQLAPLILGGVLTFLGIVFLTIGVLRGRMTRSWKLTTGIIVNRRDGGTSGIPALYPTFRWRDEQGREHQRTSIVRATLGPAPGKLVPVRFDPNSPNRAVIDSTVQSGRVFVIIGICILVLGVLIGGFLFALISVAGFI